MLDLNHILLFIACVSPLFLLAQSWRKGGLNRAWRLSAIAVLIVTGISWIIAPATAGFYGGGAWFFLLIIPTVGLSKASSLAGQQRYSAARRLIAGLRFLHPGGDLPAQFNLVRAMELSQQGDLDSAVAILSNLRNVPSGVGHQAAAQLFRIQGDWRGLREWIQSRLLSSGVLTDPALLPFYVRALGETGARNELLHGFATNVGRIDDAPSHQRLYDLSLMVVLAFSGSVDALTQLFETRLNKLSTDTREFWIGTAELVAGGTTAGWTRLKALRARTKDELIRTEVSRRLEHAEALGWMPLSPGSETLLHRIKRFAGRPAHGFATQTSRPTAVVLIVIGLNVAMFIAELILGGSTNPITLYRLGALDLYSVRYENEYWRLFTSLFLHFGPLHLIFNLYALSIIGPGLENAIGGIRFGICYLLSGLGSSLGVIVLSAIGWTRAELVVGASGCVMGLVGVWAGLLLRHRETPYAARRLKNILVIVAVQTAFDLSTPQISMAAHLSGLVTGLILGLLLAPKEMRS